MENPFSAIEDRLNSIEHLLQSIHDKREEASPQQDKEQLLTVQEAAKFLSLSVPTIYSKVHKGELPVMKRTKRLYFSSRDLMQYLKEGRIKTQSELEKEANDYVKSSKK